MCSAAPEAALRSEGAREASDAEAADHSGLWTVQPGTLHATAHRVLTSDLVQLCPSLKGLDFGRYRE